MFFINEYAYLTGSNFDLQILNISNAKEPKIIGEFNKSSLFRKKSLVYCNNFVYIENGTGFYILDTSNYSTIKKVGQFSNNSLQFYDIFCCLICFNITKK